MFNVDAPAENIGALTAWLKKEHRSDFLYRGQTKDYPVMVPSVYRHLVPDMSDPSPMAKVDPDRLDGLSLQALARLDMLQLLIRLAGVGLGNIIAQQYGLTSESLDVTESIDVASFFATRRYPHYDQVVDGIGVIYRFDSSADRRLSPPFRMRDLDDLFERGKSDIGFFDFFVQKRSLDRVFDRDRWFGLEEAEERVVSTIPFATSWRDLRESLDAQRAERPLQPRGKHDRLAKAIDGLDWGKTRFAEQHGGFLRPAIFWNSAVPKRHSVVRTRTDMALAYGGVGLPGDLDLPDDPGPIRALPLVIPSSAIKQTAIGVENIRARPDCQPFFFRHGPTRAAPILRRSLWPEPSEDSLYGALWHEAIEALARRHYPNHIPPVDDPEQGLLDRGYRVVGEAKTRDARNLDDLYRGQLEDVDEVICAFGATPDLLAAKGDALAELGRSRAALGTFANGLRTDRTNVNLLVGLVGLLRGRGRKRWERRLVDYARTIHADDLRLIEADTALCLDAFDLERAVPVVDRGLTLTVEGSREWGRLVFYRIIVAELLGDRVLSTELRAAAERFEVGYAELDHVVETVRHRYERQR
ncbi:FRG domain-containing protein [Sphingomonas ginsenosidivorax]|uniref:FRG domain-containing protein n=1 Tax=Sphingomonas ginsenosidivorax TaxID=862135 RepID=A0A5C6UEX5_9SPHN|nr:FRG domain-containing protein [Sphingomonas ginsenosidivorax]TXC71322.1 FRG domain-containing protein [Sphingomonas ginsenosidivorax]